MVESDFNALLDELKVIKYLIRNLKTKIFSEFRNEIEEVENELKFFIN